MTHAETNTAQPGFFAGLLSDYCDAKVEGFRRRIYTKSVRDLENLNDQQLSDIGVPRDQIKQRAYQSVYHKQPLRQ